MLPTFADAYWMSGTFGRRVDPVGLSSDRDGGVGFGLRGSSNFVNVFAVIEASDCDLADILFEPVSHTPNMTLLG